MFTRFSTFFNNYKTRKVVAHSSSLRKLENSNLKILKFEARWRLRGQILAGFFRLNFAQFSPDDSFSYDLFLFISMLNSFLYLLVIYFFSNFYRMIRLFTMFLFISLLTYSTQSQSTFSPQTPTIFSRHILQNTHIVVK